VLKIEVVRTPGSNIIARTWSNDYNKQHPQTLHGKLDHFQIWPKTPNMSQHVTTLVAKRTQHVDPNNVALKYCDRCAMFAGVRAEIRFLVHGSTFIGY